MNHNFNSMGNNQQDTNNYQPYNNYRQTPPNNNTYGQTPPNNNQVLYTPNKSRSNATSIILVIILIAGGLFLASRTNWFKREILPKAEDILTMTYDVPDELVGTWYSDSVNEYSNGTTKQISTNDITITIAKDGTFTQSGIWTWKILSASTARFDIGYKGKCYVNKDKTKFKVIYENDPNKTDTEKIYSQWNDYTLVGNELKIGDDIYKRVHSSN